MATVGQVYYNVIDKGEHKCISNADIFTDIVSGYNATQFTKVGIQAQPGTKVVLGTDNTGVNNKTIMIGVTGLYELDEDIAIKSMKFLKPLKYQYYPDLSNDAMKAGAAIIEAAEKQRADDLKKALQLYGNGGVAPNNPNDPRFTLYWNEFNRIQTVFLEEYNRGLNQYQSGINGIYKLPNENNLDAPENYDDLYNVIVDFIYE